MFDSMSTTCERLLRHEREDARLYTIGELNAAVDAVRATQRHLEAFMTNIAAQATRIQKRGDGDPVEIVLRSKGQVSNREASRLWARSQVGQVLPLVGQAQREATAYPENIDVLARTLRDLDNHETVIFQQHDEILATKSSQMAPENFTRTVRRIVLRIRRDSGRTESEQQKAASRLHLSHDPETGMHLLYARFDPERGTEIELAIESKVRSIAARDGGRGKPVTITSHLRAQALFELIRDGAVFHETNREGSGRTTVSRIPSLTLITDIRTFVAGPHENSISETWSGVPLPPDSLARLACDANIHEVVVGLDGISVNVGRDHRSATDGQRKALRSLYDCCPISGVSYSDTEIHHVKFWERDGPTDLENLLPISRRWHHLVHDEGWRLEMASDRSLTIFRPDKSLYRRIPPPPPLARSEVGHRNNRVDLDIGRRAA